MPQNENERTPTLEELTKAVFDVTATVNEQARIYNLSSKEFNERMSAAEKVTGHFTPEVLADMLRKAGFGEAAAKVKGEKYDAKSYAQKAKNVWRSTPETGTLVIGAGVIVLAGVTYVYWPKIKGWVGMGGTTTDEKTPDNVIDMNGRQAA